MMGYTLMTADEVEREFKIALNRALANSGENANAVRPELAVAEMCFANIKRRLADEADKED